MIFAFSCPKSYRDVPVTPFAIESGDLVLIQAPEPEAAWVCAQLAQYLGSILGKPVQRTGKAESLAVQPWRKVIRLSIATEAGLSDEGYRYEVAPSQLTITAGGKLGLAFGVFALLRDAAGCQFSGLAPDGEYIPKRASLRFEDDGRPHEPELAYRGLQFTTLEPTDRQAARLDWMLKNGMNQVLLRFNPDEDQADEIDPQTGMRHGGLGSEGPRMTASHVDKQFLPLVRERGLKVDISHHNLRNWMPPKKWFPSHPQWYAVNAGKRSEALRQLCLCTTNESAIQQLIHAMDRYATAHPEVDRIGVIPEDGLGMCECPDCVAKDDAPEDATRPWRGMLHPEAMNASKARRYARLLNRVADAMRQRHPNVIVVGAAYVDLAAPTLDVMLADNIEIWLAVYWRDGARPVSPENTSPINQRYSELIDAWCNHVPGRLYLYEYYMGMNAQHSLPYPMSRVIVNDWQAMNKSVRGATIQCLTSLHETYGLNLLTFARLGWQRQIDHDQVLADWLQGMFGEASTAVAPIFERWLAVVDRIGGGDEANGACDATFLKDGQLLPDARNIVCLLAQTPVQWLGAQLAHARSLATTDRVGRQLDRLEHYLSYCHAAARLVQAVEHGSSQEVASASEELLACMNHLLCQGWVAPAHAIRWQRMARPRLATEYAR